MRKIELLAKSHDRAGFDCGSDPPNTFLKQTARQHADRGISRTYVLVDENDTSPPKRILGFFSLNICQLIADTLPPDEAKKFPRTVPGVRLGRLAVAREFQRQGIGRMLLVAAMGKFMDIFNTAGGIGLFVDAKDQDARRYYGQFGFVPMASNELELFLQVETIRGAVRNIE